MCGTSITVAYATSIFEERLGFDATKSHGLAISLSSHLIFGGATTVRKLLHNPKGSQTRTYCNLLVIVDRFGRRALMSLSPIVMKICMSVRAGTTSIPTNKSAIYAATVFLLLYTPFLALGFLSNTNLCTTEVAPLEYRAIVAGVSTATS